MKKHNKLYIDHFYPSYGEGEFLVCELLGVRAVDIHHIDCRGMGGSNEKDYIENLMALNRLCHNIYGDIKHYMDFLTQAHLSFIESRSPFIDVAPNHVCFDSLLPTKYGQMVKQKRWVS